MYAALLLVCCGQIDAPIIQRPVEFGEASEVLTPTSALRMKQMLERLRADVENGPPISNNKETIEVLTERIAFLGEVIAGKVPADQIQARDTATIKKMFPVLAERYNILDARAKEPKADLAQLMQALKEIFVSKAFLVLAAVLLLLSFFIVHQLRRSKQERAALEQEQSYRDSAR